MVIQTRSESNRNRILYFLSIVLATAIVVEIFMRYSRVSQGEQIVFLLLGVASLAAIVISMMQIYSHPRRSHALIIHRADEEMVLATNVVHEGYKLRFLRDVLNEHVYSFSDEDRVRYKSLESDGYHPAMLIRNVRKVLLLKLCMMMFDDIYVVDQADRWEHHETSNTSEPTTHKREMPPLRAWKGIGNISA
jgi:hypothetical protein